MKIQKPEKPQQIKAFRKAARDLEADDSEEPFDAALRTIAKHRPKKPEKKR
jgi:hypothetical protein